MSSSINLPLIGFWNHSLKFILPHKRIRNPVILSRYIFLGIVPMQRISHPMCHLHLFIIQHTIITYHLSLHIRSGSTLIFLLRIMSNIHQIMIFHLCLRYNRRLKPLGILRRFRVYRCISPCITDFQIKRIPYSCLNISRYICFNLLIFPVDG